MKHIKLGKMRLPLPANPVLRAALGWALIIGGIFGFLPILGFWMIPLGIMVLRAESLERFSRYWAGRKKKIAGPAGDPGGSDENREAVDEFGANLDKPPGGLHRPRFDEQRRVRGRSGKEEEQGEAGPDATHPMGAQKTKKHV